MAQRQVTINVERYHPDKGPKPHSQAYHVPFKDGMMVLDALTYIRDEMDPTLAFRWSCRMGICGSCGMTVNGAPKLTCQDQVAPYGDKPISVAPLDNFSVIRDLVADISSFMDKLKAVLPWLIRKDEKPLSQGEYLQTPTQMAPYEHHIACINCMLCYAACPVVNFEPHFLGPAAIALAQRYNLDSRDQGQPERDAILAGADALWDCTFVGECSVVCPKHVLPAEAIQRAKVAHLQRQARLLLMPWRGK